MARGQLQTLSIIKNDFSYSRFDMQQLGAYYGPVYMDKNGWNV